jgi:DNA-binding MarR family transcriptional regulator
MTDEPMIRPLRPAEETSMREDKGVAGLTRQRRLSELRSFLDELRDQPFTEGDLSALAAFLVDAALDTDEEALDTALTWLQWQYGRRRLAAAAPEASEERGALLGFIHVAQWGLQRAPAASLIPAVEPATHAARFLQVLSACPGLSNAKLAAELGVDETEVSRVGRGLIDKGLAARRRLGRLNSWEITPRGRQTLATLATAASRADDGVTGYTPVGPAERDKYGTWQQGAQHELLDRTELLNLSSTDERGEPAPHILQGAVVAVG